MSNKENNPKSIFEMDKDELSTMKSEINSEISILETDFANKTVNVVFGRTYEVNIKVNGKETTLRDFIETDEFDEIVSEGTENYGVLCGNLFSKDGVNNEEVKEISKNLGISKKVFWVVWKKIKIEYLKNKIESIEKREEYLRKQEEKEKKVGDK